MKKLHYLGSEFCMQHFVTGGKVIVHSKSYKGAELILSKRALYDYDSLGKQQCDFCNQEGFLFFLHDSKDGALVQRKVNDSKFLREHGIDWFGILQ